MKQLFLMTFLSLGVGVFSAKAQKKEFKEVIKKQVALGNDPGNRLVVKNVFGSIKVEGYSGNEVIIEVEKTITAKNSDDLELGKSELRLEVIQESNLVILHPDAPYMQFDREKMRYSWCNNNEDIPYEHTMDFTLKVPNTIKIEVSTVNDGELLVKNTKGDYVEASNVNGGIELSNITGKTKVNCINGDVNISYAQNPRVASRYYALNGDINISYQESLSANISFKSMNGEMFTDFDISKQYVKTNKNEGSKDKPKFKFETRPVVQIGSGQVDFDFETLNGNVFIKKI